jgi:hypothetical protein
MNDLAKFQYAFAGVTPFSGVVPRGYLVDFLGTLTDVSFLRTLARRELAESHSSGDISVTTELPELVDEFWFEAVDWMEAVRAAKDDFVMVSLGACFGYQLVGACRALRAVNPMPFFLVAVEPLAEQVEWISKHMTDNGINPAEQWLVPVALSDSREPVLYPVGAPGTGVQNCYSSNDLGAREAYLEEMLRGDIRSAVRDLVLRNSTGITKDVMSDVSSKTEIKFVSALTLKDILGPLDRVDYLESDIQESERVVFPPAMEAINLKVGRVHIGTHGKVVHRQMRRLFAENGWDIVFSYFPESRYVTPYGSFATSDGILTAVNPRFARLSGRRSPLTVVGRGSVDEVDAIRHSLCGSPRAADRGACEQPAEWRLMLRGAGGKPRLDALVEVAKECLPFSVRRRLRRYKYVLIRYRAILKRCGAGTT